MAFGESLGKLFGFSKPKPKLELKKLVKRALLREKELIRQREDLLIQFEKRHPELKKFLELFLELEKKSELALAKGNLREVDRLNVLIDEKEQKLMDTLSPTEKTLWSTYRSRLRVIEAELQELAKYLSR